MILKSDRSLFTLDRFTAWRAAREKPAAVRQMAERRKRKRAG
jgi:hypothetical protein